MDALPIALAASDALPALCRRFHVRQLDLFGLAADGRFDPARSDLDFLVAFEELPGTAYVYRRAMMNGLTRNRGGFPTHVSRD